MLSILITWAAIQAFKWAIIILFPHLFFSSCPLWYSFTTIFATIFNSFAVRFLELLQLFSRNFPKGLLLLPFLPSTSNSLIYWTYSRFQFLQTYSVSRISLTVQQVDLFFSFPIKLFIFVCAVSLFWLIIYTLHFLRDWVLWCTELLETGRKAIYFQQSDYIRPRVKIKYLVYPYLMYISSESYQISL